MCSPIKLEAVSGGGVPGDRADVYAEGIRGVYKGAVPQVKGAGERIVSHEPDASMPAGVQMLHQEINAVVAFGRHVIERP